MFSKRIQRFPVFFCFFLFIISSGLWAQTGNPRDENPGDAPPQDFEPLWRQALGGAVIGPPTAQAGSVVMVVEGGMLKAFGWRGTPLWTYYVRGRLAPFVTRSREGTSYIYRTTGSLIAINRSGRELWQIDLGTPPLWPVLCGWDGRLLVVTREKAACYTVAGYPLWERALESPPALKPTLDLQGGFITALENGDLLTIDPYGGIRSRRLDRLPVAALSLDRDLSIVLVYPEGRIEIQGRDFDLPPRPLDTAFPGRPLAAVVREGKIAITLEDGRVVLVEGSDGKTLWTGSSHFAGARDQFTSRDVAMIYDERGVYTLTRTGGTAFNSSGWRLWMVSLKGSAVLPALSDEGMLYSGGGDWILYAYRPEERIQSPKQSLYGPAPEGSYGTGNPPPSSRSAYEFRFGEEEVRTCLARIGGDIRRGQVGGNEKEYLASLMEIAGSFPSTGTARLERPPVEARYRAEAARLLAYLGSRETIPFLASLFTRDPESPVKAAAAEAIGRIGVDPEGIALRAFTNAVFPPYPLLDDQALTAAAAATGALCRFSGPPLSEAGIRILSALSTGNRAPSVRNQAQRELRSLWDN